jgi:hypothetical protein
MVFNATFSNISVLSRWSALLVEETTCVGHISIPYYLENSKSIHNLLDLQLPVQSVPITTKVVSSSPAHD